MIGSRFPCCLYGSFLLLPLRFGFLPLPPSSCVGAVLVFLSFWVWSWRVGRLRLFVLCRLPLGVPVGLWVGGLVVSSLSWALSVAPSAL